MSEAEEKERRKLDPYDPSTLRGRVNLGYGLDGGGYSFEPCPDNSPFARNGSGEGILLWDSPDTSYFPVEIPRAHREGTLVFMPYEEGYPEEEHPFALPYDGDETGWWYRRVAMGALNTTVRECDCHGHSPEQCPGEECEHHGHPHWHWVGGLQSCSADIDGPCPACPRCEGDGYVECPGGAWAHYISEPMPGRVEPHEIEETERDPRLLVLADWLEESYPETEHNGYDLADILRTCELPRWAIVHLWTEGQLFHGPLSTEPIMEQLAGEWLEQSETETMRILLCGSCYQAFNRIKGGPESLRVFLPHNGAKDVIMGWGSTDPEADDPQVRDEYLLTLPCRCCETTHNNGHPGPSRDDLRFKARLVLAQ